MKKILFIAIIVISGMSDVTAQMKIKEGYDKSRKWYSANYGNWDKTDVIDGQREPERLQEYKGFSEEMQSYLNMYRITRDKAYIVKSINIGLKLISKRTDVIKNISGIPPIWADHQNTNPNENDEILGYWYDGFAAAAIAELAFIIIASEYSQELFNIPLPTPLIINPMPSVPLPPVPISTFGAVGNWLKERMEETMTYYGTVQWANDAGWLYGELSSTQCNGKEYHYGLVGLNMHSPLTVAAMYLKKMIPNSSISSIPERIANFYFSEVPLFDDDKIIDNEICDPYNLISEDNGGIFDKCFTVPTIMRINTTYNAYWWFYYGWSRGFIKPDDNNCSNNCRRPCSNITEHIEDLSHAGITMDFPIHSIPFGYFTETEMIRWRNTFTKLVWDPFHPNGPGYHSAINGDSDEAIDSKLTTAGGCRGANVINCPNYREVPLLFAPLYKYDGADATAIGPNVYDICNYYYQNTMEPAILQNQDWQSNRSILGVSRLASAQWDKDCPNLTLYNRKLVYDQDFFAKNELIVAPNQTTDPFYTRNGVTNQIESFAEPVINTPDFTVESGVEANFTAGNRIVIKKGHIKQGARSRGYIDPSLYTCSNERIDNSGTGISENNLWENKYPDETMSDNTSTQSVIKQKQPATLQNTDATYKKGEITLQPNPTTGKFSIVGSSELGLGSVYVYNNIGQMVYQSRINSQQPEIDISTHPAGIYFVRIFSSAPAGEGRGEVFLQKVVKE
jgi:hypothetical protein